MDKFISKVANHVCDLLEPYIDEKFAEQNARLDSIEKVLEDVLTEKDMEGYYVRRIANEVASRFVI